MSLLVLPLLLIGYLLLIWIDLTIACLSAWSAGRHTRVQWLIVLGQATQPVTDYVTGWCDRVIGRWFNQPLTMRVKLLIAMLVLIAARLTIGALIFHCGQGP